MKKKLVVLTGAGMSVEAGFLHSETVEGYGTVTP